MKNKYEVQGNVTAIIINSKKHGRLETMISTNKLERANEYKGSWCVVWKDSSSTFYVVGSVQGVNGKRKTVYFHRWLTNALGGMHVDHKDHDGLINTDVNLRVCTHAENHQNRSGANSRSKSGIRGVWWDKRGKKWVAEVKFNGKTINCGYFTDKHEAKKAVIEFRSKHMLFSKDAILT